jgi:hypothetical protein
MPMHADYILVCGCQRKTYKVEKKRGHAQILSYIQMYALALRTSSNVASLTFASLIYAHCRAGLEPLEDDELETDIDGATRVAEEAELAEDGFFGPSSPTAEEDEAPDEPGVTGWSGIAVYAT